MPTVTFISPEEKAIRERDASTRYVRDQRSKDVTFLLAQIDSMRANPLHAAAPAMLAALKAIETRVAGDRGPTELITSPIRKIAREAIAQAEGR